MMGDRTEGPNCNAMKMKKSISNLAVVVAAAILSGCVTQAPVVEQDVVGEYVFNPGARPEKFAHLLVLSANGKAQEVRFDRDSGEVLVSETRWRFDPGANPSVLFGPDGYRVVRSMGKIQLMINRDYGHWFEKVR